MFMSMKLRKIAHSGPVELNSLLSFSHLTPLKKRHQGAHVCIDQSAHNRAIRPCHPSHSMLLAVVLPRGDGLHVVNFSSINKTFLGFRPIPACGYSYELGEGGGGGVRGTCALIGRGTDALNWKPHGGIFKTSVTRLEHE